MVERGERTHHAAHHRHRVRITAEAAVEAADLLVQHGVIHHAMLELRALGRIGQVPVQQQVGDFQEVGVLGKLLNWIAAVQQHALVTIDVGNLAFASGRRAIAHVIGKHAQAAVQLADVGRSRADGAGLQGDSQGLVGPIESHRQ